MGTTQGQGEGDANEFMAADSLLSFPTDVDGTGTCSLKSMAS